MKSINTKTLDTKILRGGYAMIIPYTITSTGTLATDQTKKITGSLLVVVSLRVIIQPGAMRLNPD